MQQNFYYNPMNQMPPGLTKKASPAIAQPLAQPAHPQQIPQDSHQSNEIEKLNQFLNDPAMRQLLKDIMNHTNVIAFNKKYTNFLKKLGV